MNDTNFKSLLMVIVICMMSALFLLAISVHTLQKQVDDLRHRNEVITQQLQEMNRYVRYSGG